MEYKTTALIQSKGELHFFTENFEDTEIKSFRDAKTVFEHAESLAKKRMDIYDGAIKMANQITVWKRNCFGWWSEMERPKSE